MKILINFQALLKQIFRKQSNLTTSLIGVDCQGGFRPLTRPDQESNLEILSETSSLANQQVNKRLKHVKVSIQHLTLTKQLYAFLLLIPQIFQACAVPLGHPGVDI